MKRSCLVWVGLLLAALTFAAPARAAIPYTEITLFSDFGHDVVDGSEWRWTSDDEEAARQRTQSGTNPCKPRASGRSPSPPWPPSPIALPPDRERGELAPAGEGVPLSRGKGVRWERGQG